MLEGKRVTFPAPGIATLEPFVLDDQNLGPTELIVRTRVTLISPGTELARWQGKLGMHSDEPTQFPITEVGYANISEVVAAGSALSVKPGDRVYTMSNHASVARVNTQQRLCVPVPPVLPDERAVFVRLATVSMTTLRTTVARGGDHVAVIGLGLVGNLAAQVFHASGMRVNAFDLSKHRRELATACGIGHVHAGDAMADLAEQHRLVIEATGSAEALVSAVGLTQSGGEIVMIGAPWGGDANSVPSSRLTRQIFFRFLRLRSGSEWEIPRQPQPLALGSIHDNSVTALDWLAEGRLSVTPLITHELPPEEIQTAYEGLLHRRDEYLGVVLRWQ